MDTAPSPSPAAPVAEDGSAQLVVQTLVRAVEALAGVLPPDVEVVLHDLGKLPNSLVALSGTVTGRRVGDPITDYLLAKLTDPDSPDEQGYPTRLADGRELISSTTLFRDSSGRPVAALCSNVDTSRWQAVQEAVSFFSGARPASPQEIEVREEFPHDLDELRSSVLQAAIATVDVPVELMHKRHKLAVVQRLQGQGFFTLRDAVPGAAAALGVSRFTIYNYLKELEAGPPAP